MTTDINQLHKVVSDEAGGRGCGKTYSRLMQIIHEIQLGQVDTCVLVLSRFSQIKHIIPMLNDLCQEYGLPPARIDKTNMRITIGNFRIIVVLRSNYERDTAGLYSYIEINEELK